MHSNRDSSEGKKSTKSKGRPAKKEKPTANKRKNGKSRSVDNIVVPQDKVIIDWFRDKW